MRHQAKRALERLKCSAFVEAFLLPGESRNEFCDFCEEIFLEYQPSGPSEEAAAFSIARPTWRKLHPVRSIPKTGPTLFPGEEWYISWKREHKGEEEAEAYRKQCEQQAQERFEKGEREATPEFPKAREFAAEWDAQISHAHNQMVELKRMKYRAGLT